MDVGDIVNVQLRRHGGDSWGATRVRIEKVDTAAESGPPLPMAAWYPCDWAFGLIITGLLNPILTERYPLPTGARRDV